MSRQEFEIELPPKERTKVFFEQSPSRVAFWLQKTPGMKIEFMGTNKKIRVIEVDCIPKRIVTMRYELPDILQPGDLWIPPLNLAGNQKMNWTKLFLIITRDEDGVGASVNIEKADYWDPFSQTYVPHIMDGESDFADRRGDIASYFGFGNFERYRLEFRDDLNTLYIVRGR